MADPNATSPPPTPSPPPGPERKTAAPLLWILLLLALFAFGWFVYDQRVGVSTAPETLPPPAADIGDGQDAAAERERAADDARREAREARERERSRTPPRPTAGPDRDAAPLTRVEPEYPVAAYRARAEGTVLLRAGVDASGKPMEVEVLNRSGSRELDQAAIDAVRQWTFEPAVRDGKAVASEVQVPVTFRIDR